jgi:hypothetical protein
LSYSQMIGAGLVLWKLGRTIADFVCCHFRLNWLRITLFSLVVSSNSLTGKDPYC